MRMIPAFLPGIVMLALAGWLAGCAEGQQSALALSETRPSLLFFYTEG